MNKKKNTKQLRLTTSFVLNDFDNVQLNFENLINIFFVSEKN